MIFLHFSYFYLLRCVFLIPTQGLAWRDGERLQIDERERDREARNIDRLTSICAQTGDRAHNLGMGMCPDLELNQLPFPARDDTQPTEPLILIRFIMLFTDGKI